jgi:hypothetical protein
MRLMIEQEPRLFQGSEICNECGKSVAWGSGNFVNRVIDLNDLETRIEMGKPFPRGNFICAECDYQIRDAPDAPQSS